MEKLKGRNSSHFKVMKEERRGVVPGGLGMERVSYLILQ